MELNRGVVQRTHKDGHLIGYYADAPGVFYNEDGTEATLEDAATAGFDVEALVHEQRKIDALKEAREKVEAQFREQADEIRSAEAEAGASTTKAETEPVPMRLHLGSGRGGKFKVLDENDDVVESGLSEEDAVMMVDASVQAAEAAETGDAA